MARYTVDALKDKYEQLLSKVSNNSENWSEFLKKSAYLYKYSFLNQLLISEERPNARMVGTFEFWTKEKNSSVKGGVSGIPVLSKDNKVVYVFDINDTYSEYRERSLKGMNRVVVDTEIDNILSNLKINFTDNGIDKDKLTALINDSIRLTVYTKVGIDFASSNFDYIKQLSNIDVQTVGNYVSRQARKVLNSIGKYADYVEIKQQNTKDSKSYVHYNEDEIAIAKQTNLADYLRSIGEELRRVGTNEYEMAAHDSMRIEDGNRFYWNSQGFGGNTLDFLMKYYNMSFQEAVGSLLSFNGYSKGQSFVAPTRVEPVQAKEPDQPEPIVNSLPNELDTKTNRVYAYLTSNNIVNTKSKTKNEDLMTKTEKNSTVNVTFYQKDNDYVVVGDSAPKVADILHLDLKTVTLNFDEKIRLEAVIIPVALLYDNLDILQEQGIVVEFDLFAKLQLNYAVKEHRDVFITYKDEEKPEYSNYRFHHTSEGYRLMADKENEKDLYFLPDVMDYDDIYNFIMDSKTAKVLHYGSIAQNVLQDDEPQLSEKILNNMPDNTVSIAERNEYGYTSNYLLPLRTERATELLQNTDLPIYALHGDNTESQVESIEDIEEGGLFGVEYDQWEMYLDTQEHIREQQQVHNTIEIGDKFKNKISGEISEVVLLTGALSWYTDQCTVERESRGFVITENIDNARLLNTTLYEFIGNEKEQTVNLQTQVPVTDTVENSAQIEQNLSGNNIKENSVKFNLSFTESALLKEFADENPDMSFALANSVIEYLDEKQHTERENEELDEEIRSYYDKTHFSVNAVIDGENYDYDGRYDIGDGKGLGGGSIVDHIREYNEYYLAYEDIDEESKKDIKNVLNILVPYLEQNAQLTEKEQEILDKFKTDYPIRNSVQIEQVVETNNRPLKEGDIVTLEDKPNVQWRVSEINDLQINFENVDDNAMEKSFSHIDFGVGRENLAEKLKYTIIEENSAQIEQNLETEHPSDLSNNVFEQKEIDRILQLGINTDNYWQESHSSKEKADFLKNEYGTGGHSHALSGTSGSSEYYDSTGLRYKKNGCEEIKMSWIQAASRLDNLVHNDRYLTDKEKSEHYVNLEVNEKKEPVTEEVAADKAIDTKAVPVTNYHITDNELGIGGAKAKFTDNINSIKTLKLIESENRQATLQEQKILAKYVGWGGLQNAFDSRIDSWSKEYTELKSLLTDDEYTAARASVLDAHYTPPVIISSIYDTLSNLGFESGKILEPSMGIGNFFGLLPQSMQKSKLYGVELDSITGRIAKQLYPNANIQIKGFEKTAFNSNTFDVAIGNVPFGTTKISDNDFKEDSFIHDYFFKKSLDKVRPGGIVAFITSSGTLDKKGDKVKKYLAERADFLGAVRLPNNAFKNAGTPVVADIIFLQKKDRITELIDEKMPEWVNVSDFGEHGTHINNYFVNHPEMVCGTLGETTSQYGYAVTCKPSDIPLEEQLKNALSNIKGTYEPAIDDVQVEEKYDMPNVNVDNYRNFCYAEIDGEIYFRENERLIKEPVTGKKTERLKGMIEISSALQELIAAELQDYDDENTSNLRNKLNAVYDKFTAKFGILSSKTNKSLFREDDTAPLLLALENIDKDGNLESKSDIFTKRTIQPYTTIDHTDTAVEALAVSISEKGRVDVDYMAQLCGTTEEDIVSELKGVIFENPVTNKYENADEYLSGNVKEKLKIAKDYAQFDSKFNINVSALSEVQPPDLKPEEISVQLGSTWVPVKYYQQFMYELLETPSFHKNTYGNAFGNRHSIVVDFNSYSSQYKISNAGADRDNIKASVTYGTSRVSAYELIEDTLNLKNTVVNDRIIDENDKPKYVQNKKETLLAQEKQDIIKQRFKEWIFDDYDRTQDIVKIYNDKFNSIRLREYDGSHITFKGMSSEITLRKHQVDAIAHTLYGGNTLLAHSVGAGKSFEMIASAMESKRLGLCHKSLIVVPKAIVAQMSADFLRLYPTANILVPKATDFNAENRQKFCSRIATGNYDAVIISHEQLDKIPLSVEYQTQFIQERLDEIEDYLLSTKYANDSGNRGFTIKQLESTKKNLENRLEALNNDDKRDTTITFEELGVDKIYVDEAHLFKNKYFNTKMSRVAGISTSAAQRSEGLYMKCRYLDEKTGSRGVVFATGTPISNSMVEMYTMQTYLQFDELKRHDLHHFDAWASTFGETVLSFELAPEGYNLVGR